MGKISGHADRVVSYTRGCWFIAITLYFAVHLQYVPGQQ